VNLVRGCELPDHLWYQVDQDVWVDLQPDGTVRLGMTDPAQTRAGKILHVQVRARRRVDAGRNVATVESGKWVGPVPAPFPGLILGGNPRLADDPALINRDPYGEGWLAEMQPDEGPEAWPRWGLVPGHQATEPYRLKLEAAGLLCVRCQDVGEAGGEG